MSAATRQKRLGQYMTWRRKAMTWHKELAVAILTKRMYNCRSDAAFFSVDSAAEHDNICYR